MGDRRHAWATVVAGFLSTYTVFGVAYSFGAFFGPMADEFGAGSAATSAVFSVTAFLYFLLGAVSGRAADRFGPRPVLLAGAVAMAAGLAGTAAVDRLWLGYVTYGVGVGIGVACGYVPMLAVIGGWFDERRSLALGIAVAGVGIGTLTVAPLAGVLITRIGWRATYLAFAAGSAALLLLSAALAQRPPHVAPGGHLPLRRVARTPAFVSLYGSGLLLSLALFVPFVFLPPFAETRGASKVAGAALIGVIGGTSVVGRLALGAVGDRIGRVRTYQACFLLVALSFPVWLASDGYGSTPRTEREAQTDLDREKATLADGTYVEKRPDTVGRYLKTWLDCIRHDVSAGTCGHRGHRAGRIQDQLDHRPGAPPG